MTETPIPKLVITLGIPTTISMLITNVYNMADTYFVGLLNDPNQTAAITIVYPSFVMLTAISNLFGIGGASLIARKLGRKDERSGKEVSSISFWLGLLAALLFSLFFLPFQIFIPYFWTRNSMANYINAK